MEERISEKVESLVGTGLATCKLVGAEGDVIKEKLLQGQKIFGQTKKHVTLPPKHVDINIVTISDDEDSFTSNSSSMYRMARTMASLRRSLDKVDPCMESRSI